MTNRTTRSSSSNQGQDQDNDREQTPQDNQREEDTDMPQTPQQDNQASQSQGPQQEPQESQDTSQGNESKHASSTIHADVDTILVLLNQRVEQTARELLKAQDKSKEEHDVAMRQHK
ncbi:hypothetical protein O0I10_013242 [Lichtheimia ornata]|uniref:Uncharacterized protein n=1 Tax=Lichtheimia ornata TaxID=688661 RepID=A0AAD7URH4_9FUNG|nr:uncharacterized protein O0I10_013242 [Lichtheimia ornata]KAJ8651272.1 hypothetical protein O0I10_013242 [Lichtheimia ornata]